MKDRTRYAIITNPTAGKMSADRKRDVLAGPAGVLQAQIHGLDTVTADELAACARGLAETHHVLVIAGGDGTFSDMINAVDTARTPVAFLPLGSGNALAHAFRYKGLLTETAKRIRDGAIRTYDLIDCDGMRRAFTTSVGLEGTVLRLRDRCLERGVRGFRAYMTAFLRAALAEYEPVRARIIIDRKETWMRDLLTLVVAKQPYYGYGVKVVPGACFDDGQLHILKIRSRLLGCLWGLATSLTLGNRVGQQETGGSVKVALDRPVFSQMDGNIGWERDRFRFDILAGALKIKGV